MRGKHNWLILALMALLVACQRAEFSEIPAVAAGTSPTTTRFTPGTTAAPPVPSTWRLMAVGDVLLDDTEARGVDAFTHVSPPLARADLSIVNLETAVADAAIGTPQAKQYVFRSPPSAAETLGKAGVDVVNLGNNHSLDYGPAALIAGIRSLRAAGVDVVGAGANSAEANTSVRRTIGGARIAVLGASRVIGDRSWIASPTRPGVASAYDVRALTARVRAAKAEADVVILVVHWGTEGAACPEPHIVSLGKALRSAGATVVLGSHPHVLQPVVQDGDGLIAYSLGNFAFHYRTGPSGDSTVLDLAFDGARLVSATFHPHLLNRGPPRPADPASAARIRAALDPVRCAL